MRVDFPITADLRVTHPDGRVTVLTWLHDGFAATVPCTHPGCYTAAVVLMAEIAAGKSAQRACLEHAPVEWLTFVRQLGEWQGWPKTDGTDDMRSP